MKSKREDWLARNVVLDVWVLSKELKDKIIDHIRMYQVACSKVNAACYMAEMAGAEISNTSKGFEVKANSKSAKSILENAFDIHGKKAHLYETRLWIRSMHPTWLSIVPEAIHMEVSKVWRAKDSEITKATRGWLQIQHVRRLTQFNRIGIYIKNTVPKLEKHCVRMKWDDELGDVELKYGKLDGSRWTILRRIMSGEYALGSMSLKKIDTAKGPELQLLVSYRMPPRKKQVKKSNKLYVEFGTEPKNYMLAYCGNDKFSGERISVDGVLAQLDRLEAARKKTEDQRGSYHKRQDKKIWRWYELRGERQSAHRSNVEKEHNHLWTRRIIEFAIRNEAGTVIVVNKPEKELFGRFWSWYQFQQFLAYKIGEVGGEVKSITVEQEKAA